MGTLGIFSGIAWMLEVYGESHKDLKRTAAIVTYVAHAIIVCLIIVSGLDIVDNAFANNPPGYLTAILVGYGALMLILLGVLRNRFIPDKRSQSRAQLYAVYLPTAYIAITVVTYAILTSYGPAEWQNLDNWKTYAALAVTMFFPALSQGGCKIGNSVSA